MKLFRGLYNLPHPPVGSVVTIGNFDGVHRGHQAVIQTLCEMGREKDLPTTLICFEPTPQEFFAGNHPPARLTRLGEKLSLLAQTGLDQVLVLRFDARLAQLPADTFVKHVLVEGLAAKQVLIGADFRYGHQRKGTLASLMEAGEQHGFEVKQAPTFNLDNERISSSRVRAALANSKLELASRLLGRNYSLCGRVIHGDKRGREWGYPTVNIPLQRRVSPVSGIYIVQVDGAGPQPVYGAASIGTRPTVGGEKTLLEVHLLDFNEDIYGHRLQVTLLHKLREEAHFDTVASLRAAIDKDVEQTRAWLQEKGVTSPQPPAPSL
ncbi:MAG TPA: bifunctional riboflavin kinase/FAD synthetase [Gammaproteobacteria bacterium]|nr:bifunctional riboflavin kinase/FAD synthetase [Gammaproteobacteria bacterium]